MCAKVFTHTHTYTRIKHIWLEGGSKVSGEFSTGGVVSL